MSTNDNSLYGFLKKGSVFSPSKNNNRRRSRSRSRDSRQQNQKPTTSFTSIEDPKNNSTFTNPNINPNPNPNNNFNNSYNYNNNSSFNSGSSYNYNGSNTNYNQSVSDNLNKNLNIPISNVPVVNNNYVPANNTTNSGSSVTFKNNNFSNTNTQSNNNNFQYHQQSQFETPVQRLKMDPQSRFGEDNISQASQNSQNTLWTGILSYSSSFESARVESSQCLENLSMKITRQISSINSKIDLFNSRMAAVLGNQFRAIKQKIQQVFEAAFKESDKYIQEYMKQKEALLAGQLMKMKTTLEKELTRIDSMKLELAKPQWRKVAGEILSTELEHHVQNIIQQSSALEVGKWELGDITGYRIKNIQSEIREIVRLKAS